MRIDSYEGKDYKSKLQNFLMYKNLTSEVYSSIVSRKNIIIELVDKWEQELNCDLPLEDLDQQFRGTYCVTNSAKLRSFQLHWF